MDSIKELANIPLDQLTSFLKLTNGFIGGSAALYGYMKEKDLMIKKWQPNDIDIWIPVPGYSIEQNIKDQNTRVIYNSNMYVLKKFIIGFFTNYNYIEDTISQQDKTYPSQIKSYFEQKDTNKYICKVVIIR